jgi:hypothetical protein
MEEQIKPQNVGTVSGEGARSTRGTRTQLSNADSHDCCRTSVSCIFGSNLEETLKTSAKAARLPMRSATGSIFACLLGNIRIVATHKVALYIAVGK